MTLFSEFQQIDISGKVHSRHIGNDFDKNTLLEGFYFFMALIINPVFFTP